MSTSVSVLASQGGMPLPETKPLDQAVWRAWVLKGIAEEKRSKETFNKTAKWLALVALIVAVGLWAEISRFEIAVRFLVAAGSIFAMVQALESRRYAIAAVFAALLIVFNPIAPLLSFAGGWQHAVVAACALPFAVSILWKAPGTAQHA